ncbi:MAG: Maf-like protein [Myxococcales bacterium]
MAIQVILASSSPRRKDLLEQLGFAVKVIPANVEEKRRDGEEPEMYVKRLAREKVLSVVQRVQATQTPQSETARALRGAQRDEPARWVVGADTVVVLDGHIFEKPADTHDAFEMLLRLEGRQHEVISGFCVYDLKKNKEGLQAVRTGVTFKAMSKTEIERYIGVGEGADKAGAYAVQGVGAYMVERLDGSYTNVVGLPLCQVVEMMQEMGANDLLPF